MSSFTFVQRPFLLVATSMMRGETVVATSSASSGSALVSKFKKHPWQKVKSKLNDVLAAKLAAKRHTEKRTYSDTFDEFVRQEAKAMAERMMKKPKTAVDEDATYKVLNSIISSQNQAEEATSIKSIVRRAHAIKEKQLVLVAHDDEYQDSQMSVMVKKIDANWLDAAQGYDTIKLILQYLCDQFKSNVDDQEYANEPQRSQKLETFYTTQADTVYTTTGLGEAMKEWKVFENVKSKTSIISTTMIRRFILALDALLNENEANYKSNIFEKIRDKAKGVMKGNKEKYQPSYSQTIWAAEAAVPTLAEKFYVDKEGLGEVDKFSSIYLKSYPSKAAYDKIRVKTNEHGGSGVPGFYILAEIQSVNGDRATVTFKSGPKANSGVHDVSLFHVYDTHDYVDMMQHLNGNLDRQDISERCALDLAVVDAVLGTIQDKRTIRKYAEEVVIQKTLFHTYATMYGEWNLCSKGKKGDAEVEAATKSAKENLSKTLSSVLQHLCATIKGQTLPKIDTLLDNVWNKGGSVPLEELQHEIDFKLTELSKETGSDKTIITHEEIMKTAIDAALDSKSDDNVNDLFSSLLASAAASPPDTGAPTIKDLRTCLAKIIADYGLSETGVDSSSNIKYTIVDHVGPLAVDHLAKISAESEILLLQKPIESNNDDNLKIMAKLTKDEKFTATKKKLLLGTPALKDDKPQIGKYANSTEGNNLSIILPNGKTESWPKARCMIVTRDAGETNLVTMQKEELCKYALKTDITKCFVRAVMKYMDALRTMEDFDILDAADYSAFSIHVVSGIAKKLDQLHEEKKCSMEQQKKLGLRKQEALKMFHSLRDEKAVELSAIVDILREEQIVDREVHSPQTTVPLNPAVANPEKSSAEPLAIRRHSA